MAFSFRRGAPCRAAAWIACAVALPAAPLAAAATRSAEDPGSLRVLHAERLAAIEMPSAGSLTRFSFSSFGRRFDLELRPNERLADAVAHAASPVEAWRGRVLGVAGSWARITRSAAGLSGMIYAGGEVFVIEPAREVAARSVQPLPASGVTAVIYRLSDTVVVGEAGLGLCGTESASTPSMADTTSGLAAFRNIVREAKAGAASLVPNLQMRVGVVADLEFFQRFGADSQAQVIARFNIVDGIFNGQVGVKLQLAPVTVLGDSDGLLVAADAPTLLSELRAWRSADAQQQTYGVTHLMTGRDMTGDTVGIAYIGSLCQSDYSASLSEGWRSTTTAALIAAHEIGHNFGAPHDGDPAAACAATPTTFLMAPQINGNDTFSQCSLDQMQPVIAAARCVTSYTPADAAVTVPTAAVHTGVGLPVDLSYTVSAAGTETVTSLSASSALPVSFTVNFASVPGGSCSSSGGAVACSLGDLAGGSSRVVTMNVTPTVVGSFAVTHTLSAANDSVPANDSASVTVTVDPVANLAVDMQLPAQGVTFGASADVLITVTDRSAGDASGVRVVLTLPGGLELTAIDPNPLGCSASAGSLACASGSTLAGGASVQLDLHVTGRVLGSQPLSVSVSANEMDPDTRDNLASGVLAVTSAAAGASGSSGSGGSGGGGALGAMLPLALLLALARKLSARPGIPRGPGPAPWRCSHRRDGNSLP